LNPQSDLSSPSNQRPELGANHTKPESALALEPGHPGVHAINFELLNDYFDNDPVAITQLLTLFQSSSQTLMLKLGNGIAQRNAPVVVAIAHEIRGSCGNIGIDHMAQIASLLETVAPSLDWPVMESSYQELMDAFKEVVAAIARH
jgi:HPt (histidine-containing phosphotransfer) domain-containing protein